MKIVFSPTALEHLEYWRKTSPATVAKIKSILSDISEHPFSGIAKPEPLKGPLKGLWSRRINQEHRLIYKVEGQEIQVLVLSRLWQAFLLQGYYESSSSKVHCISTKTFCNSFACCSRESAGFKCATLRVYPAFNPSIVKPSFVAS